MHHAAIVAISVAAFAGASALLVPRRLQPHRAARLIAALVLLSFCGALWTLCLVIASNIAQLHGVAERLSWCTNIVSNHRGSFTPSGLVAVAGAVAAATSMVRIRARQLREPAPSDARELAIIAADEPVAYALPGRPGQVVISTAMLRSLDPQERRVVVAHERSHLRRRHHRYLRMTELVAAALPILRPLNGRVRFAVERWADEDAAVEVGDRATVARAIARAALASHSSTNIGLAIADAGVVERVQMMLAGPSRRSWLVEIPLGLVLVAGLCGLFVSIALIEPQVLAVLGLCG